MLMPYVKAINHAGIAPDFFKLLAPFYPRPAQETRHLYPGEYEKSTRD
jgi:hypothetical protein